MTIFFGDIKIKLKSSETLQMPQVLAPDHKLVRAELLEECLTKLTKWKVIRNESMRSTKLFLKPTLSKWIDWLKIMAGITP